MKPTFAPEALQKIIDSLPADAPQGTNVVVGAVDTEGLKVHARFKLGDKWQLEAAARKDWDGDASAGAKLLVRW